MDGPKVKNQLVLDQNKTSVSQKQFRKIQMQRDTKQTNERLKLQSKYYDSMKIKNKSQIKYEKLINHSMNANNYMVQSIIDSSRIRQVQKLDVHKINHKYPHPLSKDRINSKGSPQNLKQLRQFVNFNKIRQHQYLLSNILQLKKKLQKSLAEGELDPKERIRFTNIEYKLADIIYKEAHS